MAAARGATGCELSKHSGVRLDDFFYFKDWKRYQQRVQGTGGIKTRQAFVGRQPFKAACLGCRASAHGTCAGVQCLHGAWPPRAEAQSWASKWCTASTRRASRRPVANAHSMPSSTRVSCLCSSSCCCCGACCAACACCAASSCCRAAVLSCCSAGLQVGGAGTEPGNPSLQQQQAGASSTTTVSGSFYRPKAADRLTCGRATITQLRLDAGPRTQAGVHPFRLAQAFWTAAPQLQRSPRPCAAAPAIHRRRRRRCRSLAPPLHMLPQCQLAAPQCGAA